MKNKRKGIQLLIVLLIINIGLYLWANINKNKRDKFDNYNFNIALFFIEYDISTNNESESEAKLKSVAIILQWFSTIDFYVKNSQKKTEMQLAKKQFLAIKTNSDYVAFSKAYWAKRNVLREKYFKSCFYIINKYKWYVLIPLYGLALFMLFKRKK